MQIISRGFGLALLLLASAGSALAMDQSAMEETNCLAACDSNSENCMATGASAHKPYSPAKSAFRETGASLSLRRTAKFSQMGHGARPETQERQR